MSVANSEAMAVVTAGAQPLLQAMLGRPPIGLDETPNELFLRLRVAVERLEWLVPKGDGAMPTNDDFLHLLRAAAGDAAIALIALLEEAQPFTVPNQETPDVEA